VEAEEALAGGAAIILFTGSSLDDLRQVIRLGAGRARVQVSGAIPFERIAALAAAGVEIVKIGSITESAPAAEITFELRPA
jgi:nicotinate-nucleotide pyrophosphorylase (carboxylating)